MTACKRLAICGSEPHERTTTPAREMADVLREARDIIAGKSKVTPTVEHLEALQLSGLFWKATAQDLQQNLGVTEKLYDLARAGADELADSIFESPAFGLSNSAGEESYLAHLPELDGDCEHCLQRAEFVLSRLNHIPLFLCRAHAQLRPEWCGGVQ